REREASRVEPSRPIKKQEPKRFAWNVTSTSELFGGSCLSMTPRQARLSGVISCSRLKDRTAVGGELLHRLLHTMMMRSETTPSQGRGALVLALPERIRAISSTREPAIPRPSSWVE